MNFSFLLYTAVGLPPRIMRKALSPREHVLRCDVRTIETDLEVAVVAGGTARAAQIADELALLDGLACADGQGQAVGIHGAVAAAVADDDRVAIARCPHRPCCNPPWSPCRLPKRRWAYRPGTDIHALVAAAIPARAVPVAGHRPDKLTAAGDIGAPEYTFLVPTVTFSVTGSLVTTVLKICWES